MAIDLRMFGVALTLGGCGLVYGYGDYRDAPDAGTGGSGTTTTVSTSSTDTSSASGGSGGGTGGCVLSADIPGDCRTPTCAGGVPGTAPDDMDLPVITEDCRVAQCTGGTPTTGASPDGTGCSMGVCFGGTCVECIGPADCDGRCCEIGNTCRVDLPSCTDACRDGSETGIDCGGGCGAKCPNGEGCGAAADCASGHCDDSGHCALCQSLVDCNGGCCHVGVCGSCP